MTSFHRIVMLLLISITSPVYSNELQNKLQLVDAYFQQMSPIQHYSIAVSSGAISISTIIYQANINNTGVSEARITSNYPIEHSYTIRTLASDKTVAIFPKTNKTVLVTDVLDIAAISNFLGDSKFSEKMANISKHVELVESSTSNTFSVSYVLNIEKLEENGLLASNSPSITVIYTFQNTGKLLSTLTKVTGQTDCSAVYTYYTTSQSNILSYLNALPSISTAQIDASTPFDEAYELELEATAR